MALLKQSEYAATHGVSRKTVTKWKEAGRLVFQGGLVDVEASDRNLKDAGLGRFGKPAPSVTQAAARQGNKGGAGGKGNERPVSPSKRTSASPQVAEINQAAMSDVADSDVSPLDFDTAAAFLRDLLNGRFSAKSTAERVKENALAGVRVLEFLRSSGSLVELELARNVLFEQARTFRDALMKWPTDIGPRLAAEIDRPADTVTGALTRYVHALLTDLGEPDPEFAERDE